MKSIADPNSWGMIDRMIEELPTIRPETPLLDTVVNQRDTLGEMDAQELVRLADELRQDSCTRWRERVATLVPVWAWSN